MLDKNRSTRLFEEARRYLPGGVDSPVRAFKAVGGNPIFVKRGRGSRLYDEDGNEFLDYVCSWGPLILGHAHPRVVEALKQAIERGTSFGAPTELETQLARTVCEAVPSIETVRFTSSGTEATMSALRLARAFTNRDRIVKFAGCYHGHSDGLLVKAGSGAATLGLPDSPGVPPGYAENTLVAPYNDLEAVEQLFARHGDIAAVIVEPVAANMGVVPPKPGFLEGLRNLTEASGALLVLDEVVTGFRVAYGGAQGLYGVTPDLTCLGKIIGGGLPVGAYGGRADIMELTAPVGPVYQAGTLSGNPLAMTAGIETLATLREGNAYAELDDKAGRLAAGIAAAARSSGTALQVSRVGSLLTVFFSPGPVVDYESARLADTGLFAMFFQRLLREGIYWPPSQYEAAFLSLAHSGSDVDTTIAAVGKALADKDAAQWRRRAGTSDDSRTTLPSS
ncbi:MAG: glutamate-1-semialdehyde 2,1-aminomutase [Chloroflexota bacterium]|nr:glutamate-1-semialdehyde 2,1-aminomutase [Chloroflexota bacterium]